MYQLNNSGFPHGLENLEKWKTFSSQGILNQLEKSGNFSLFLFYFFSEFLFELYLLLNNFLYLLNLLNKTLKKYWKIEKIYWKSQGKIREMCQSKNVGTMTLTHPTPP